MFKVFAESHLTLPERVEAMREKEIAEGGVRQGAMHLQV